MMVIVPVDTDINEAQDIAQEDRRGGPKGSDRRVGRYSEVQHHDRDDNGEDTVTESFETPFIHRSRFRLISI